MDDLNSIEDNYEEFVNMAVMGENNDFTYVEDVQRYIKQEKNEGTHSFAPNLNIKVEFDELNILDYGELLPLENTDSQIYFKTEVIVKKEEDQTDYDILNCLDDFKNKILRIQLTRLKCFMCEHCSAFYKTKRELVFHIHTKHVTLLYKWRTISKSFVTCVFCKMTLPYRRWHEHMTIVHSSINFQCKLCHRAFKHNNYLRKHVRRIHKNIKPAWTLHNDHVECPICFKTFTNKHSLHTHNKTSHSQQTYTCSICNSTLKCKTYLNTHMRRVHYNDGKKHVCKICNKEFKSPRYLRIHEKYKHK